MNMIVFVALVLVAFMVGVCYGVAGAWLIMTRGQDAD